MAKRILLEAYTFTPSARTVTITGRYLRREQLILITNVNTNTVIYNFADSALTASAYSATITNNVESTTITLTYDTTSMASDSKLAILVEENNESFQPSEVLQDPIGKLRVSLPQSLIDTDFEYGVQPTKWEALGLMNNRPSAYYDFSQQMNVVSVTASGRLITVLLAYCTGVTFSSVSGFNIITYVSGTFNFPLAIGMQVMAAAQGFPIGTTIVGTGTVANSWVLSTAGTGGSTVIQFGYPVTTATPVFVQDSLFPVANGWVMPSEVPLLSSNTPISFKYQARDASIVVTTNIFDPYKSYMYLGTWYSGAGIPVLSGASGFVVTSGSNVQCTTVLPHGLTVGSGIMIANSLANNNNVNITGNWVVKTVLNALSFTFDVVSGTPGATTLSVPGAGLTINYTAQTASSPVSTVTVSAGGSGYNTGDVVILGTGGGNALIKITAVSNTPTVGVVTGVGIYFPGTGYPATGTAAATTTTAGTAIVGSVLYAKSWGSSIHRPFDGGVQFSSGLPYHGNQTIRQTRRYFRYQSGKGISFNTGSNFCAPYQVETITYAASLVTVTVKTPHNLGKGATIKVSGCDQPEFNGTFAVATVPATDLQFTYVPLTNPVVSVATGGTSGQGTNIVVQPFRWYGSQIRTGMFDAQNGFFFQYDGQTVYAVRRSSTTQLSGVITNLGTGNQVVTGSTGVSGTKFCEQLSPGDFVVIRGQSYTVVSIESQNSMTIYPDYRGAAIVNPVTAVMSKTIDTKIPQSAWNIDTCLPASAAIPGTSGFVLDVSKMQMWLMDYTWYGAGPIRWGFKNHRGEAMYAHRLAHGNSLAEAYMRSGNLPARYEANTYWPVTKISAPVTNTETGVINVISTAGFPTSGTICLQLGGLTTAAVCEFIDYTGISSTTFTGLTRGRQNLTGPGGVTAAGGMAAGQTFAWSATGAQTGVFLYAPQAGATISHWGSAVMMDGRYDDDKSVVFNYGMANPVTYATAGVRYPVFSIRLSPSVDSGYTGLLGIREIVNRMQLQPVSGGVYVTGSGVKIEVFLNSRVSAGSFTPVGGSSLAQYASHPNTATLQGGECLYTFFAPAGGVSTQDMSKVRDIGNSILGGGNTIAMPSSLNNVYPDGPDILTVCITPLTGSAVVVARLNWSEAQA